MQEWGQSPTVSCSLSPSFSPSLVCKCISISYDLSVFFFSLAMISIFLIPSHSLAPSVCFPLSLFLSLSPSPRPVLPSSSSLFLLEFSSLCVVLFSSLIFFWRGEFRIHEERKSSPVVGIAAPVKLVERVIHIFYALCLFWTHMHTLLVLSSTFPPVPAEVLIFQ